MGFRWRNRFESGTKSSLRKRNNIPLHETDTGGKIEYERLTHSRRDRCNISQCKTELRFSSNILATQLYIKTGSFCGEYGRYNAIWFRVLEQLLIKPLSKSLETGFLHTTNSWASTLQKICLYSGIYYVLCDRVGSARSTWSRSPHIVRIHTHILCSSINVFVYFD